MLASYGAATYQRAIEAVAKDKAMGEFFARAAHFGAKAVVPMAVEGAGEHQPIRVSDRS